MPPPTGLPVVRGATVAIQKSSFAKARKGQLLPVATTFGAEQIESTGALRLTQGFGPNQAPNIRWRHLGETGR